MADSPTKRSLKKLREEGYLCQVVEHWNPFARVSNSRSTNDYSGKYQCQSSENTMAHSISNREGIRVEGGMSWVVKT